MRKVANTVAGNNKQEITMRKGVLHNQNKFKTVIKNSNSKSEVAHGKNHVY